MLLGMAGYLVVGLAIPHAFGRDGVALGIGYLIVVAIHGWLYQQVNRNIARVVPFNLAAALLIIGAGVVQGWAAYVMWAAALAIQQLSPLITRVRGRFAISPSHFVERHGALIIVVFGESVVDIGIGAEGHPVTVSLALSAVLGLALAAALWWAYFGVGDDDRAEEAMLASRPGGAAGAGAGRVLLRLHPDAARHRGAGLRGQAGHREHREHCRPGHAWRWAAEWGCSWAGTPAFRHALRIGPERYRLAAAGACLAASALGVTVSVAAEMGLLILIVAAALVAERRGTRASGGAEAPPRQRIAWRHDRAVHAAGDGAGLERGPQVRAVGAGRTARPGGARPGGAVPADSVERSVRPKFPPLRRSPRWRRSPITTSSPS